MELAAYLPDAAGPLPLVLDLRIALERWGRTSNPSLNGQLHYPRPDDIDRPLNEAAADKILANRVDYQRILFLQANPETVFLLLQEFSVRNPTSSTTVARRSAPSSNLKLATS